MNNILKTFEIFLSLPISLIRRGIVQILHVETESKDVEKALNVTTDENGTNINVVNNYKMYTLLSTVMYKKQMYEKNNAGKIYN